MSNSNLKGEILMKKRKIIIPVICGILAVSAVLGVNAYARRKFFPGTPYVSENTFENMTATIALCSEQNDKFLLILTDDNFAGRPYTYSLDKNAGKQLEDSGIQAGDFAEITFSGCAVIGCEGTSVTVNEISSCQELAPTEALSRRTHEIIPSNPVFLDKIQIQIYQNQNADFLMMPVGNQIYAYTPDSDEALIFEDVPETLHYFNIGIPEPTDPELTCPYTIEAHYFKSEHKQNMKQRYSSLLNPEEYARDKEYMPEELQNFIESTWNGSDGMFIMERRDDFDLTDEATIYFPHDYSGLFNSWAGHGNPVDYAVLYIPEDEFKIMEDRFFGRD